MDRDELKKYLPHREPMLLVDEMTMDADGVAHATYRIREDEFFCQGHFPGNPLVPGVILCEIMAQSCALLVKDEIVGKTTLYSGIDHVQHNFPSTRSSASQKNMFARFPLSLAVISHRSPGLT